MVGHNESSLVGHAPHGEELLVVVSSRLPRLVDAQLGDESVVVWVVELPYISPREVGVVETPVTHHVHTIVESALVVLEQCIEGIEDVDGFTVWRKFFYAQMSIPWGNRASTGSPKAMVR